MYILTQIKYYGHLNDGFRKTNFKGSRKFYETFRTVNAFRKTDYK